MQKITAQAPESKSPDLAAQNLAQLKALFPELVTESKDGVSVNLDVLKQLVGDKTVADVEEKYGLNWHGKRRARQIALTPSTGTLRPCPAESVDWDTTQNLMIEGDNLEVLKLFQKSYSGKMKLIYIDPPYNTGKDFVYPDNFQDNIKNYLDLTGQTGDGGKKISSNTEASGRYHTDWLNLMYPRLKLARNLLRADGVIFITIDDHEIAALRCICDEVFGEENCLGILIWQHSLQPKGYAGTFSVHHNYVLCYQKSADFELMNLDRTDEHNKNYSNPDNDPNGSWRAGDVRNALYRPNLIYKITTPTGKTIEPPPNGWRWSKDTLASKIASGEIVFSTDETRIIRKIYLNTLDGRTPETILFGKEHGTTRDAASEIKDLFDGEVPFDTPKPTSLVQHLISLSGASADDLILDFFAGSGTTGEAVMKHNLAHQGNLRFVLVQLPEPLDIEDKNQRITAKLCDELGKPRTISELTKERLRRAGAKLRESNPMFSGDLGMRVFKLADTNIKEWNPESSTLLESLESSVGHLKLNRTDNDILFELLLKLGLPLTIPIVQRIIAEKPVQSIGGGSLIVCLSNKIEHSEGEYLAIGILSWLKELKPAGDVTIVFKDSSFPNDVVKTNVAAILQQGGIENVRSL